MITFVFLAGTHWLCIYHSTRNAETWFFDSFGKSYQNYSPLLSDYMHSVNSPVLQSVKQVQRLNTSSCGEMCLFWAYYCLQASSWKAMDVVYTRDFNVNHRRCESFMLKIKNHNQSFGSSVCNLLQFSNQKCTTFTCPH